MDFPQFENSEDNQQNMNFDNQQNMNFDNQQNMNFDNQQNMNFDNQQNMNFNNQQQQNTNMSGENEIQIENMEFSNKENMNQSIGSNKIPGSQGMDWNAMDSNVDDGLDEVEKKRIQDRKEEEEARRAKALKKMNDEMRIKQEFRDKAREYIDNWNKYL